MIIHQVVRRMLTIILLVIASLFSKVLTQCNRNHCDGVRLVGGLVPSEGRVEVCTCVSDRREMRMRYYWGTVCRDEWDDYAAKVVCRELGHIPDGARALWGQETTMPIVVDHINCNSNEAKLHDCVSIEPFGDNCRHGGGASVRCREEQLRVKVVRSSTFSIPEYNAMYTAMISWELYNGTSHRPTSFTVVCFSQQHSTELSVNNETFMMNIGGLYSSTSYNCCVTPIYYYGSYTAERKCTLTEKSSSNSFTRSSNREGTIGGVLGLIIVVLVLLLAIICVAALLYLLRSRGVIPKRPSQNLENNSTEIPVGRNISYVAAPSTTSGSQAIVTVGQGRAAAEYNRIGPSYETTVNSRRQQPVAAGRNQVSARLSERYEFSETHLALAGGSGGVQGEGAMDYEIPLQSGENQEYSHLQH